MSSANPPGPTSSGKGDCDKRFEKLVSRTNDVDTARAFVQDAASVASGLWISYLGVLVYIAVAAGAVTHEDLFLERPVKLPFLGDVPLPLVAFFVLAPIVFVIWQAYTLLHFEILASKVRALESELQDLDEISADAVRQFRWQLPANIFVQLLAGHPELRKGRISYVSQSIAWISLVIGPILLLLLIQVQFLPYHSEQITWLHRFLVVLDLVLLWVFWPVVVGGGKKIWSLGEGRRTLLVASCAALLVSVAMATFPGEWIDSKLDFEWIPPNRVTAWLGAQDDLDRPVWTSFHDLLFSGPYDERSQRRRSLFSNTLVLPNFVAPGVLAIEEPKSGSNKQTRARKRRHFEKAVFRGADLHNANLENAHLEGASFYQAKLQDAQMYHANLRGADFYQAELGGASFVDAELGRVKLRGAHLEGADLLNASLQGAIFDEAEAQGANFDGADLRGARLRGAQLQAASFKNAQLQGACLDKAQLSGADFSGTKLGLARLNGASVGRAALAGADLNRALSVKLRKDEFTKTDYDKLRARFVGRTDALARVDRWLNPSSPAPPVDSVPGKMSPADAANGQQVLAGQLASLVCSSRDEDVGNVVWGLIRDDNADSIVRVTGSHARGVVDQILSSDCLASPYLTSEDKAAIAAFKEKLAATTDSYP
jgi:uncharacterized protein YjbI with pentapeptide repeats